MGAVIWLIAGLVLIAAEVLVGEFTLLMLGGSALAAAAAMGLGASPLVSALVFGAASVLLIFAVRPPLRRRLERGIEPSTSRTEALIGGTAVVVTRVDGHGGRVRLDGEIWSARSFDPHEVIEAGEKVTVLEISGATAMVVADRARPAI